MIVVTVSAKKFGFGTLESGLLGLVFGLGTLACQW